jgi:hypothetical protein
MAGIRFASRIDQLTDDDGAVASGAKVYFYLTGTSTPTPTYFDDDLDPGHSNTNPVVYDSAGRQPVDIFLDPEIVYRVRYEDADGNLLAEDDPIEGSSVALAIAEHNADPDAHLDATESQRGMTTYANDAEAIAKVRPDCSLTPANLAALTPSTTMTGLVERATSAEIEAGTDDVRYISPLGAQALQATSAEISAGTDTTHFMGPANFAGAIAKTTTTLNGKIPGLTFKVGVATFGDVTPSNHYVDVTFPEAFGTACLIVLPIYLGAGTDADVLAMGAYAIVSKTTTGCRLYVDEVGDHTQSGTLLWLAIGY